MILRYEGIVEIEENPTDILIGGKSLIRDLDWRYRFDKPVTIAFADESFDGDLSVDAGATGYSELTPGELSELKVGEHDLLDRLGAYEDKQLVLWIADEPINTLDPPPSWANKDDNG